MAKKDPNKVEPYVFHVSENEALLLAMELTHSMQCYELKAKRQAERGEDAREAKQAALTCAKMSSQLKGIAVMR